MRLTILQMWILGTVLALGTVTAVVSPWPAFGQEQAKAEELTRKPRYRVSPVYPDIARRMSISGTVKLAVVVAPNGSVRSSKPVGGHPALVNAAMDAVKQWKFETAPSESSGIVEFKFQPQN